MYGGTALFPPPEFVLADAINAQAETIKDLEARVLRLEEELQEPQRVLVDNG